MLINPYHPDVKLKNFPTLYDDLESYYDYLYDTVPDEEFRLITPRFVIEHGIKAGFRDIFYYIDQLYDNNPESIIDAGCGECIWKKWFPRIIGFDPTPSKWSTADFIDFFDEDFSKGHHQQYTCGMGINSLHFVHWEDLPKQIKLAMDIVKDRFLFTFNFNSMLDRPEPDLPKLIGLFDDILKSLDYNIILVDYPSLRGEYGFSNDIPEKHQWSHVNGHVRFILSHGTKNEH